MAQLAQRLRLYLTDTLARDVELLADLLQRARAAVHYAEAQLQHLLLARGQRVQHLFKLLAQEGEGRGLARLRGVLVGDEVAQMRILLLTNRCFQGNRLLSNLHNLAHLVYGHVQFPSEAEKARDAADKLAKEGDYDLIIVDLPGTVNSRGVFNTIVNMDYVITPIAPDRIVMQSSLAFSTTVIDYSKERKDVPVKDFLFFWNKKDGRASTEVFDTYNLIMKKMGLTVLDTVVPHTNRYDKELSLLTKNYFRCTLMPPPAKALKGSGLAELAEELIVKLNLK